jgi:hypothetical protein
MIKNGLALLALFAAGCAPYVPLGYTDENSPTLAKIDAPELTIYLEHIGSKYQHNIFDLEVINHTLESIFVYPQQISFYFSEERFPRPDQEMGRSDELIQTMRLKRKLFVRSPDAVRSLFEQKEKARATVGVVFSLISVGLSVYNDVKTAEDRKKSSFTEKDVKRAATREALVLAGFLAADIAEASKQKAQQETYYLPYEIFNEGKIDSLARRRGKIFLPEEEGLRYLRLIVPIENKEYIFDFKRKGAK